MADDETSIIARERDTTKLIELHVTTMFLSNSLIFQISKIVIQKMSNKLTRTMYISISLIMTIAVWWSPHTVLSVCKKLLFNDSSTSFCTYNEHNNNLVTRLSEIEKTTSICYIQVTRCVLTSTVNAHRMLIYSQCPQYANRHILKFSASANNNFEYFHWEITEKMTQDSNTQK